MSRFNSALGDFFEEGTQMGRLLTLTLISGLFLCGCSSGSGGSEAQIMSFTATPANLPTGGGTVTLAWNVTGATSLSINQGVGAVSPATTGSTTAPVTGATTFTLSATNAAGTVTATASVCVSGAVTLAVTGPSSYTCGALFQAQFAVTNGSCEALTVTNIELTDIVNSGMCSPSAPSSYPPATATVPVGETVTVLNLQTSAFCCTPGPTCSVNCSSTTDYSVATSAGTLTADAGYTIDLMDCTNICM
jgi:hypothetical protein